MKIVAQSLVPANPLSYLHVGYTAAVLSRTTPDVPGFPAVGWLLLCTTIAGVVLLSSVTAHAPKWRRAGVILLVSGAALLTVAYVGPWPRKYSNPEDVTRFRLRHLRYEFFNDWRPGDTADIAMARAAKDGFYGPETITDGWKRRMRATLVTSDTSSMLRLRSAGPDGAFDTADDMVLEEEVGMPADRDGTTQPEARR